MRPENSSKLCEKTFCDWSRVITALSSVTPERPVAIADCEMPLAAASFLKSSSQASNDPVPQGAASAGAAEIVSNAPSASALMEKPAVMIPDAPKSIRSRC